MNFVKLSKERFISSHAYREGVNDMLHEILNFQKNLLDEEKAINEFNKIYDEAVNDVIYYAGDDAGDFVDWIMVFRIVNIVYTKTLEKINFFKLIKRELNKEGVGRSILINKIHPGTRLSVMKRDCYKCRYCGGSPSTNPRVTLIVDSIQSVNEANKNSLENYQTLCHECEAGKNLF